MADHLGEGPELRRRVGGEPHPSVGRPLDRRHLRVARHRGHRRPPRQLCLHGHVRVEDRGGGLEHRDVDVIAGAEPADAEQRAEPADRGGEPGGVVAHPPARRQRLACRLTAPTARATPCLQRELVRGVLRPRAGAPEGRDGDDHQLGAPGPEPSRRLAECRRALVLASRDHEVGPLPPRSRAVEQHRALGRVHELEERGIASQRVAA